MTGVVIDLANWYVPMVLYCNDRFVKTTNPQKKAERGTSLRMFSFFGVKIPSHAHAWSPRNVMMKCMSVKDMPGNS